MIAAADIGGATDRRRLIDELENLHGEMVKLVDQSGPLLADIDAEHRVSAGNLLHYLALRRHDIRTLQERLASLGLSSLGRTEPHVLNAVRLVLDALASLDGAASEFPVHDGTCCGREEGRRLLERNTEVLLGPSPAQRKVRIMVTMPSEAAADYELIRELLTGGMNCMRVNCAHDDETVWAGMIANLRRAEQETGLQCKVEMDLAGPKLRTGPVEPGPAVVKCRPRRDPLGHVVHPARIWLTPTDGQEAPPVPADAVLPVPGPWLASLERGDVVRYVDAREAKRTMTVVEASGRGRWAESAQTSYFTPGMTLTATDGSPNHREARVGPIPCQPQFLHLSRGDELILTRSGEPGEAARLDEAGVVVRLARIGVSLPELIDCVRTGEPVWLDDGKIGGVVTSVEPHQVTVRIRQAPVGGAKLGAGKGINLPETQLQVPSLTEEDLAVLPFVIRHADFIGYSFVRTEEDVRLLQERLAALGGGGLGIVLKIETREAFDNLPGLLLTAMRSRSVGVMIARGDLAVECGYERLAEVQEEILWIAEAAHMPVIWATQVLESLAKSGMPSRSEITDAAMGERAECVMLNKGPYVVDAVRTLDDILRRMQAHHDKKRSMLRRLRLAGGIGEAPA